MNNEVGVMNWGVLILVIIFAIINFKIYHKLFHVYYFSTVGFLKELLFCFIIALMEAGIIIKLFSGALGIVSSILGGIGKLILGLLKILLILAAVAVVIAVIYGIVQAVGRRKGTENGTEEGNHSVEELKTLVSSKAKAFKEKINKPESKTENKTENEIAPAAQSAESVMICPKCGKEFPENMKFCCHCGGKLEKKQIEEVQEALPAEAEEQKAAQTKETMNICTKCGKELPKNGNFCIYCGEKVAKEESAAE